MSDAIPCARCGAPTDPNTAVYSGDGMLCTGCEDADVTNELWKSATQKLTGAAVGAVLFGAGSLFINPCFFLTGASIASGVGVLTSMSRHPEYRQQLGSKAPLIMGVAILGILIAVGVQALRVLATAALVTLS